MDDLLHAFLFILLAGVVFFAVMVWERGHLIRQGRPQAYDIQESLTNIAMGFTYKVVDGLVVGLFIYQFFDAVYQVGLQLTISNHWLHGITLFLLTDLLMYLVHMLMHKVRYAWCSHVTHHSSSRFNFSTALRQNFLMDLSGVAMLMMIPMSLIGFDKTSVIIAIELNLFYQFFIHTETVGRLPNWFETIFNTPSHHRVHHGSSPKQIDTNFGGVLIIWDRFFGTFVDERDAGLISYGIAYRQPNTLNPLRLNLGEWFAMWGDVWRFRDLRILWKGPDWVETLKSGK